MRWLPGDAPETIRLAAAELAAGAILCVPTPRWYMLACSGESSDVIARLYAAKGRPVEKGLLLWLGDAEEAPAFGILGAAARKLASRFWPGNLALHARATAAGRSLAPRAEDVLMSVEIGPARALAEAASVPILSSSANVTGDPPIRTPEEIEKFSKSRGGVIDIAISGGPDRALGQPLTIVDCRQDPPRIERSGAVPDHEVEAALGS